MTCERRLRSEFLLWGMLAILLWTTDLVAGQVRCPVCHQLFVREVEVCPNDGTDLTLLGRREESETASDETKTDTPGEPSESRSAKTRDSAEEQAARKYQRHDIGGARKRVEPSPEDDFGEVERRDRLRRLKDARAGWTPPAPEASVRSDDGRQRRQQEELLAEYAVARDQAAADRNRRKSQSEIDKERRRREKDALFRDHVPVISMGNRVFFMGEGASPGVTSGLEVDANLIRTNVRVSMTSFVGVRHIEKRRDVLFLENIALGVQHPWHLSPYLLFRLGLGVMLSERFGEQSSYMVRTIGFDIGMDCRVGRHLFLSPSVGYTRMAIYSAGWDTVTFKVSVGF